MNITRKNMKVASVACLTTIFAVQMGMAQDVVPEAASPLDEITAAQPVSMETTSVDVPEDEEIAGVKVGEAADASKITVSLDSVEMADVVSLFTRLSGC